MKRLWSQSIALELLYVKGGSANTKLRNRADDVKRELEMLLREALATRIG